MRLARISAVMLAALLSAGMLAGCSGSGGAEGTPDTSQAGGATTAAGSS